MKVLPITPRGFCPGVVRAIAIVEKVLADPTYPRPIQILGMIVHNRYVVDELKAKGALTVFDEGRSRMDLLAGIDHGTIVITAHGADPKVFKKARDKGLAIVDATCKDVYLTHETILQKLEKGYEIIFVGKRNHPETEAVSGLSERITVIESVDDIATLPDLGQFLFATNQTTFSHLDLETVFTALKDKYPKIEIQDEICHSTRIRQEAIIAFNTNQTVDLCYIVGDPLSNNSRNLAQISETKTKTKTLLIESVADIKPSDLENVSVVSVSSGASTPSKLTNEVIAYLQSL
ncbi:MAG: 4-hydroxy-3-methylbut-2-enyl diphosphate reductase [Candidatus Izemoplasmatales bacterium]